MTKKTEGGPPQPPHQRATLLVTGGRDPSAQHGFVNPPVYHASTVLFPSAEDYLAHRGRYQYGRRGTPTSEALSEALKAIEGPACAGVALFPSGLAAISTALLAACSAGDHLLMVDTAYLPARKFCDDVLARLGVEVTYYDPMSGASIADLMRPNTRAVYTESPGSLSFEVQDLPAIAAAAHARGALVLMDNTWATPLYFRAFEKGADLVIQSGSKYIGGHSDLTIGTVSANAETWRQLNRTAQTLGIWTGPDDMFLALRGLRTMGLRLAHHYAAGVKVAQWLNERPEIARVLHPALASCPGHEVWRRDFTGACGLFAVVFKPAPQAAVNAFLDELSLFGIGASWGGYESLAIPFDLKPMRTATQWSAGGPTVRFHIGLEDVSDLIADLERGFAAFAARENLSQ
jgi:cystathionine beta-lyase